MTAAAPIRLSHYYGGAWRESAGDRWHDDLNPSDPSDVVARVPDATPDEVRAAVDAAAAAFPAWRNLTGPARAEHLYKWAGAIADRAEEMAQTMAREVGKPIAE